VPSPIGPIGIRSADGSITEIRFHAAETRSDTPPKCDVVWIAARQLEEYFAAERRSFDLPLAPAGTAFQQTVWRELTKIPYGGTISYGQLARTIGKPDAVRAVGAANGRNPFPIVIPCHRVIGSDGTLVGFGGGLDAKRFLLGLERGSLF